MAPPLYKRCPCSHCSKSILGPQFQTQDLIKKHITRYGLHTSAKLVPTKLCDVCYIHKMCPSIDNHYSSPAKRGFTRQLPLHKVPRNIDAESRIADPQDIPVGDQTPEAAQAATQILVWRTSGIAGIVEEPDQRWDSDDGWEGSEYEIPTQVAEGEGHAEPDNPLPNAEDWPQERHLGQDEPEQPTWSGTNGRAGLISSNAL